MHVENYILACVNIWYLVSLGYLIPTIRLWILNEISWGIFEYLSYTEPASCSLSCLQVLQLYPLWWISHYVFKRLELLNSSPRSNMRNVSSFITSEPVVEHRVWMRSEAIAKDYRLSSKNVAYDGVQGLKVKEEGRTTRRFVMWFLKR